MSNKIKELILYDEKICSENNLKLQVCLKGEISKLNINNISVNIVNDNLPNTIEDIFNNQILVKVKLNLPNKNIIKVHNGIELQKALSSKDINVIVLCDGIYRLKEQNIHISQTKKTIIGNKNTIFTDTLIVESNTTLKGMKFINQSLSSKSNANIYVKNGAILKLLNVKIDNLNSKFSKGIILENYSKSKINIYNSTITNTNIGVEVNSDNIIGEIKNNTFNNVDIGICNISKGTIIDNLEYIKNNSFKINKNKEAISFSTGLNVRQGKNINLVTNGVKFARKLCLNNNYALIKGYEIFNDIETKCYKVTNNKELIDALSTCKKGNIILISKGKYYGNIVITKEIALIGESTQNTIIIPQKNYTSNYPQYGIEISSGNLLIKDLTIDGKGNYKLDKEKCHFRDGIRYLYKLSNNNKFKNINIKNTIRRGISIWPELTNNTIIENCTIENIKGQQCILFNGSGIINNCTLKNSPIGIQFTNTIRNKQSQIIKNIIINNMEGIILNCNNFSLIKIENNIFKKNIIEINVK